MAGGATLTNAGTVLQRRRRDSPAAAKSTGTSINQGTVTINQSVGIDHLNNQAAGTVALSQNQSLSVTSDSLSNAGTITIPAGATINATQFDPSLTNTGTITATGDGHITGFGATFNAGQGSTLTGTLPLLLDSSTLNQQGGTISTVRARANDSLSGDIPAGESLQIASRLRHRDHRKRDQPDQPRHHHADPRRRRARATRTRPR